MPISYSAVSLQPADDLAIRLRHLDWRLGERLFTDLQPENALADATTYVGIAPANALATDPEWTILRTKYDANGLVRKEALLSGVVWTTRTTNLYPGDGTQAFGTVNFIDPTIPVAFNIFENDVYPEDYGWSGEQTAEEVAQNFTNFINAIWGGTSLSVRTGSLVTITILTPGTAGNNSAVYGSNPDGAVASGVFTGGTDPE